MVQDEMMRRRREWFLSEEVRLCGSWTARVRERQPLVHLLTNYVTVNDCVNAVLAIGGRAICSHAPEEAAQVTSGADALVCNLGGTEYYDAMEASLQAACTAGIPIVIDPVGCAASSHRRVMCLRMVEDFRHARSSRSVLAIRGNHAEIEALLDDRSDCPGLDSAAALSGGEERGMENRMREFSRRNGVLLIASGETDLCTDGRQLRELRRGTPALRRITGAGCLSSAVLAAFLAASSSLTEDGNDSVAAPDPLDGACAAISCVSLAGEAALETALASGYGAGHFHMFLMDFLSFGDPVWE